jgi:hypothetical protein
MATSAAAPAPNYLAGYDMVVAITQNEINSQFQRLFGQIIQPEISANGLSSNSFLGGGVQLSSWLRGFINAPQVKLSTVSDPLQVLFYFTFQNQNVTAASLGVQSSDLDAAFAKSPDGANGMLVKQEDISYRDENQVPQTLANQLVYYWLTRTQTKIGSTTVNNYSVVPALFYTNGNNFGAVSLAGLQASFMVHLDKIPTNAAEIAAKVAAGIVPPELLQTIKDNAFDSEAFSLEQLFLNLDTVDFTQWDLTDPAGAMGGKLTAMSVSAMGAYSVATVDLNTVLHNDPTFSSTFSSNLQYAFGLGGKNTQGSSPYIVGVNVSSLNPQTTNPDQPPSLVPTYIGYSTVPNSSDATLSALVYQVLGGTDFADRVPKNNDGTVMNVSTNLIRNNDFSGELLFARAVFFDPKILNPIMQGLNQVSQRLSPTSALQWTQNGRTWSGTYSGEVRIGHDEKSVAGTGAVVDAYQDLTETYTIEVTDSAVNVTGSVQMTVRLEGSGEVFTGKLPPAKWWKDASLDWSSSITMSIDSNQQLQFAQRSNIPQATVSDLHENGGAKGLDIFSEMMEAFQGKFLNPIQSSMDAIGNSIGAALTNTALALNQNIAAGLKNNFISPTGLVFSLNAPRYNDEFDLQMDVTYRV